MNTFLFCKRDWLLFFCMLGIAGVVTGQFFFLNEIPITPFNDMARHVAMAENFFAALTSGQILPRLETLSPALPDLPLFQYYGFMTGLVALPGMLLGISAFKSLLIGVLLFRIVAVAGVYWCAKLLGGNRSVSLLAALVYFMTPYIISTFYGRVAIPEALAHCELPFLVLGLLLGLRGFLVKGVTVIAITILLLSLTHPIFLLYGCGALVLISLVSCSRNILITGFVGLTIGILLSAFQWYPALTSQKLLTPFSGISYRVIEGTTGLTYVRGLFSFPQSIATEIAAHLPPGSPEMPSLDDTQHLYLTPGWFTLPVLLGLMILLLRREKRTEKLIILIPGIVFLCLSYNFLGIFRLLPSIALTVQFPYRLLSFAALFVALGLPLLFPRLNRIGFVVLALLAMGQSSMLIFKPTYQTPLLPLSNPVASTYASFDYAIIDKEKVKTPRILATSVERKIIGPYSRQFQVKGEGPGLVQLPIAYSPFFVFTQNKHLVDVRPDAQGLALISTNDLTQPIEARYRLPWIACLLPIIGLITLFCFARRFRVRGK